MVSFRLVPRTELYRWMWFGLITLAAFQVYYVREMVAALVILSVLFTFVGATGLMVILLDLASQRTFAWAGKKYGVEPHLPHEQHNDIPGSNAPLA